MPVCTKQFPTSVPSLFYIYHASDSGVKTYCRFRFVRTRHKTGDLRQRHTLRFFFLASISINTIFFSFYYREIETSNTCVYLETNFILRSFQAENCLSKTYIIRYTLVLSIFLPNFHKQT